MAAVMIGVDPHKASHTAVAISAAWPQRTWAVEGAGGTGHLLAQQLVSAGERVAMCSPGSARGSGCWPPGT